ncbi:precorrin-3B C(17)-methyltransferase [Leptospira licerasiae]|uniref:Precorrin-3B C(17)-methyltransferase n=1 Tax=Leptospira licerasiae str. MMD4847 TaxID=1049971 RepID=A0ABP2RI67_9LEPT|nr:precorrin-3B C(17)-methyltransferase [Leptospira licerasiae]EIE00499.1 precorrin-3B C(17)-methyltransferase [Leptospira licerasiae serovar Varillal str. VAR 010]EJZ43221.1 precorrin-3B C(17)-methyltransferase [Leptospira licerasiae str. MMD4847]
MKGKLNIVGIGPGNDLHITPAALSAIKEADSIIGYTTYINLVKHHLSGKQVTRTGMTEEITRAQTAVESAKSGQTVTLISSGDAGVYGMAGLVFEVLRNTGWKKGDSPEIRMIPGISADSSCGSLVGAPMVHDSARISLSDLLTPWTVIENRIESAAKGDFVINLYNPASGRRQRQIVEAARIIKKYRTGTTPVALVKSAYRRQENIQFSDLDHFLEFEIGMNTTVIIGSSQSFVYEGFFVTPRGYGNKYSLEDGSLKPGQNRAVSLRTENDLASRIPEELPSPNLNITKIQGAFVKTSTTFYEQETEEVHIEDSSVETALKALQFLEIAPRKKEGKIEEFKSEEKIHYLGRIGGAILYKNEEDYYLIGKLKRPTEMETFGFYDLTEQDQKLTKLKIKDRKIVLQNRFDILITFVSKASPQEVYDLFSIYRNSSISERLWNYVLENSRTILSENNTYADARWLGHSPKQVWSSFRDSILKCD